MVYFPVGPFYILPVVNVYRIFFLSLPLHMGFKTRSGSQNPLLSHPQQAPLGWETRCPVPPSQSVSQCQRGGQAPDSCDIGVCALVRVPVCH